jgi:competence protein ComEC
MQPCALESEHSEGDFIAITGEIASIADKESSLVLEVKEDRNFRVLIYIKNASQVALKDVAWNAYAIGNRITAHGDLFFFETDRNPGNFNLRQYYAIKGIRAGLYAEGVRITDPKTNIIKDALYRFRCSWKKALYDNLGNDKAAVISAILLGDKTGLDADIKDLYRENGIGHILAISGLHLSFLGLSLYEILRRSSGSFLFAGIGAGIVMALYMLMVGVSASIMRAFIMLLFRVGAGIAGRHYDAPTALSFSAVISLIINPLCIYEAAFWLSYGLIAAILTLIMIESKLKPKKKIENRSKYEKIKGKIVQGLIKSLIFGLGLQILTIPLMAYFFYEFPLYAPLLNLWVIPLLSVLILASVAGSLISVLIPFLGSKILFISGIIVGLYDKGCEIAGTLPAHRIVTGKPSLALILIYYIIIAASLRIVIFCNERGKIRGDLMRHAHNRIRFSKESKHFGKKVIAMVVPFVVTLSFCISVLVIAQSAKYRLEKPLEITMLDVGQGECIFAETKTGVKLMFDCGSTSIKKVGRYRVEPFLRYKGISKIDYVFVSHGDYDHINAIEEALSNPTSFCKIKNLVLPDMSHWDAHLYELAKMADSQKVKVLTMKAGDEMIFEELKLKCLYPDIGSGSGNDFSLTLALSFGDFDMLFTGDNGFFAEENILQSISEYNNTKNEKTNNTDTEKKELQWEVLKIAHHGSKNATSSEFLSEINPAVSIISAGKNNRYNHPNPDTIKRLGEVGSDIFVTAINGAIIIKTDEENVLIEAYID